MAPATQGGRMLQALWPSPRRRHGEGCRAGGMFFMAPGGRGPGPTGGPASQGLERLVWGRASRAATVSGECELEGPTGAWAGARGGLRVAQEALRVGYAEGLPAARLTLWTTTLVCLGEWVPGTVLKAGQSGQALS